MEKRVQSYHFSIAGVLLFYFSTPLSRENVTTSIVNPILNSVGCSLMFPLTQTLWSFKHWFVVYRI